ncbi:hypothetical protein FQ775_01160 [Nitratireductor mangrovi]|uniref:Helix-turn-helix domain-containing protein n=1 Tax=Nitratireductor mangrovi TaxID=2599600 RepID=A0A5B8KU48_9HYPH|nr:hypothetical protein [Nitratireductor mangrovi]QDY99090.1 hypothetical protein FQ775_01160 [Nitratireductor mangrovi]
MSEICPHCGQPLPSETTFDPTEGMVYRGGQALHLGARELIVMQALQGSAPRPMTAARLQALIGGRTPARRVIFVLRRKLSAIGLAIENHNRAGYRLVERADR